MNVSRAAWLLFLLAACGASRDSKPDAAVECVAGAVRGCGSDIGACQAGTEICEAGHWSTCQGGVGPAAETCDGVNDEDCDGAIDERCACTNGATKVCGTDVGACELGTQTCREGQWSGCEGGVSPAVESCNGSDDDCDEIVDEGSNACGGVCALSNTIGAACDGSDADACTDDMYVCAGRNATACSTGSDNAEICDGDDDDCDGIIDEGNNACGGACPLSQMPGTACDGADSDVCTDDVYMCAGRNATACSTGANDVEACNGADDDCDGTIDEGGNACGGVCPLSQVPGAACDGADSDLCTDDVYECSGRNATACSAGVDSTESCNATDDDCDGTVDEGSNACGGICALTDAPNTACDGPDTDVCTDDVYVCTGRNATTCSTGTDTVEACNGVDDDCDGTTDEGCCLDGIKNGDETDVDCGGSCGSCMDCQSCLAGTDCQGGACSAGRCQAAPTGMQTDSNTTVNAYRRADGAILLAHYGPGTRHSQYNPAVPQMTTIAGGATPPAGWAPDLCVESGHISFTDWNPGAREVIVECGTSRADIKASVSSSTLFASFANGVKGTYGAVGAPGWGMIAAIGSGQGRSNHASCGAVSDNTTGGIAYCTGPGVGNSFANHLVSYYSTAGPATPFVGCNNTGCNGPSCTLQVWVWLK